MIHYLAVEWEPLETFLASGGRSLAGRIAAFPYERLFAGGDLPGGTYLFSDIERLRPHERRAAAAAWRRLAGRPDVRLLNHPTRVRHRYPLLRALHAAGINRFRAYRVWAVPPWARWPIFLRTENQHRGPASRLLHSPRALAGAARRFAAHHGWRRLLRDVIAVEHLDTADEAGVYRKYACYRVGNAIIPRHVFFARRWMVKHPGLWDEAHLAEERRFLEENPHEAAVRRAFELARIDFGRMDYAVCDGRVQVWEINTNPMMARADDFGGPRLPVFERYLGAFLPALEALDDTAAEATASHPRPAPI